MGIVSCPTLSSDYFCLKYFGFVYDQSLQWKSSLDSVRHWSSNFFDYETGCLQCFLFGKQNNGTKTKICLSTFHQIQHNTFFEFGGKMWWNTDLLLIKKDLFEPKWMQPASCWFSNLVMLRVGQLTMPIFGWIRQVQFCQTLDWQGPSRKSWAWKPTRLDSSFT